MFDDITEAFDKLFLMEFFKQTNRINKEKSFKKKCMAFKEFLKLCETRGIKKTSKINYMHLKHLMKTIDPALTKLTTNAISFMLLNLMPKDTVESYRSYCKELYG
jgi:hypothetical protein